MGSRILVVDADRVHCAQLEGVLGGLGHDVTCVHDGVSGLEQAGRDTPELILVAADLPEMDGWDLVRHLRESDETGVLPAFLMLPGEDQSARVRAFQVGADACLVKPIDYDELAARIQRKVSHQTRMLQRFAGPAHKKRPNRRTTSLVLSGKIEKVGIASALSVLELEGRTGSLRVKGPGETQGRIVMYGGQVLDAEVTGTGEAKGAEAVFAMLGWVTGRFIFRDDRDTVHDGGKLLKVQELLLEAARRSDETSRT